MSRTLDRQLAVDWACRFFGDLATLRDLTHRLADVIGDAYRHGFEMGQHHAGSTSMRRTFEAKDAELAEFRQQLMDAQNILARRTPSEIETTLRTTLGAAREALEFCWREATCALTRLGPYDGPRCADVIVERAWCDIDGVVSCASGAIALIDASQTSEDGPREPVQETGQDGPGAPRGANEATARAGNAPGNNLGAAPAPASSAPSSADEQKGHRGCKLDPKGLRCTGCLELGHDAMACPDRRKWKTPEAWLAGWDTGTSSRTIYAAIYNRGALSDPFGADIPWDPSDLGRCQRLLALFPAWRARLPEVAKAFPIWGPFVREWDALTTLYEQELPSGKAPRTWALLTRLAVEAGVLEKPKEARGG